jgi:D-alanyl-D-alanine carboxypeptidase (penicillin-binding protein 5/6)
MKKKNILILAITIISLAGFIFVMVLLAGTRGKGEPATLFTNAEANKEEKQIEDNVGKYQPKESGKTKAVGLELSAKSAIVVDENTNEILYQKEPNLILPPASITKIDTISVALENLKPDDLITISDLAAGQEPNKIVMKAGEKMHLSDLLYGLMMISANDAAYAIAEAVPGGYDKFIELMNDKVRMLGLKNTKFTNPSGLDGPEHRSTAFDIATLTRYALLNHPEVVEYTGKRDDHSVYASEHNESHWWGHISAMLYRYPGMIAAKTGYTDEAQSTFIGIAERNSRRLVVVLLGATDANNDVPKLLDFGFAN